MSPVASKTKLLVFLLLALHAGVLLHTATRNSETYDEPMYLLASRSYWERGDFSFNREHPPLTKLLIGLPLKLAGLELPADYHTAGATQLRFMYELNDDPKRTLFLGRLPMIGVGLLLWFYVFLFARLFGGDGAGVAALAAYALSPGIIGNTPLAALDLGGAAFAVIALYHLARARIAPSHGNTLIAGFTLGLAQLTKFSNLLMLPVYGVIALYDAIVHRSLRPVARLAAMGLVAASTMFAGYGFEMRTVESVKGQPRYDDDPAARAEGSVFSDPMLRRITGLFGEKPVPMLTFLKGYDYLKRESAQEGHASFFRGEAKNMRGVPGHEKAEGWKTFYLVSLAVKTPIGLLVLAAFAILAAAAWKRRDGAELPLLLFPAALFAYFSFAPTQLGLRYVLPVLPALCVLAGRVVTIEPGRRVAVVRAAAVLAGIVLPLALAFAFPERGPLTLGLVGWVAAVVGVFLLVALGRLSAKATVVACLTLAALELAPRHPHHLFFYNAFAGGPDHGYKILSVGDDWGQGTSELAELQRERGWGEIAYDYYGTGLPEIYGLKYRAYGGEKTRGLVAAHAIQLTRERVRTDNPRYVFLDGRTPIARVNSIFVFEVADP